MSDTPRTDANLCRYEHPAWPSGRRFTINDNAVVLANFARQLERELAEAIAQRNDLLKVLEEIAADTGPSGWWWGEKMIAAIAKLKGKNHE